MRRFFLDSRAAVCKTAFAHFARALLDSSIGPFRASALHGGAEATREQRCGPCRFQSFQVNKEDS